MALQHQCGNGQWMVNVQFGFMPGRGTTDAIFAARQVIEKHQEMQKELHLVFIDLEKAYHVPIQGTTTRSLEVFERAGCS